MCLDVRFTVDIEALGQAEIDHLDHVAERPLVIVHQHEIGGFQVAMHDALARHRAECRGHLVRVIQRLDYWQRPASRRDHRAERSTLHELHCVIEWRGIVQVDHRGNVRVAHFRSRPRLAQEQSLDALVRQQVRMDELQDDLDAQLGVERAIGDAHAAATKFQQRPVSAPGHFVLAKLDGIRIGGHGGQGPQGSMTLANLITNAM